jgi:hypothetical protein
MADKMSIDKADPAQHQNNNNHLNGLNGHSREETDSLVGSSPEGDHHPAITSAANATQEPQQPKRKGGRKPVSLVLFSSYLHHIHTTHCFPSIFEDSLLSNNTMGLG